VTAIGVRLLVLDGGILEEMDPARFGLSRSEVSTARMSVPAYLVLHPRGVLMWDTGCVPDDAWQPGDRPVTHPLDLPNGQRRRVTLSRRIGDQLRECGLGPSDVTHLGLSHYHYDHTGNANLFASATWLVPGAEREAMFATVPPDLTQPADFASLRVAPTEVIEDDDLDVFGDGSVRICAAPGHTPGHQVLRLRLRSGRVVYLSGDLYHYRQERDLDRVPGFEFDPRQTRETRASIEHRIDAEQAELWIQHDLEDYDGRARAPAVHE
jgi:glyoxylase-like metal-dependent hydrolase (beta-lactamase superfamily II)